MHPDNYYIIWGLRINEPWGSLTDVILAIVCLYYFYQLRKKKTTNRPILFIQYFFLLLAFSTAWGAFFAHAFFYAVSLPWKLPAWIVSMVAIMLIERAAIEHNRIYLKEPTVRAMRAINLVEFFTFLILTVYTLKFIYVEIHAAYGLLVVLFSLELFLYYKTRNEASKYLLIGVLVSGIAFYIFHNRISPGVFFDALTLSHIFMIIAVWLFYEGAKRIDMSVVR